MNTFTSDSVKNLIEALVKAQSVMASAPKSTKNTFFGSKYATLADVWDTIREPLTSNGLCVTQVIEPPPALTSYEMAKEQRSIEAPNIEKESIPHKPNTIMLVTRLYHVSGEWIESRMNIPVLMTRASKEDSRLQVTPQSYGSAVTYARRYAVCAIVGVASDDDDGQAASRGTDNQRGRLNAADYDQTPAIRESVYDRSSWFTALTLPEQCHPAYQKALADMPDLTAAEKKFLHDRAKIRHQQISEAIAKAKDEKPTEEDSVAATESADGQKMR
jgi:hypothetical protein